MAFILFFVGLVEMLIVATWTMVVSKTKVITSGIVTVINIFIWYYVLQTIIENVENFTIVALYALGCACGTMVSTWYFSWKEKGNEPAFTKWFQHIKTKFYGARRSA